MFFHNFKYTFKILLKNKTLIFWTIAWPLILGTLFNLAFSNMTNSEKLNTISIGVIKNDAYENDQYLSSTLEELGNKDSESYLLDIHYAENEEELKQKLEDKNIVGYILCGQETKMIIKENGMNQTIVKYIIDQVEEYKNLVTGLTQTKIEEEMQKGNRVEVSQIYQNIMSKIAENKEYTQNTANKNMDYMMIEYYTLIAMACLYGSLLSAETIKNYMGNINKKGARVALAPIGRLPLLLSGLLASFIVQMVSIAILLLFTTFLLKVDYGTRTNLVILLSVIGSLAGLSFGTLLGSISFKSDNTRIGISNIIVMAGCFFAGMMGVVTKYMIDKNVPLLNKINPANMITDGFYALYYYEDLGRFYFNMASLIIFAGIMILASYYFIRRKRYDSI